MEKRIEDLVKAEINRVVPGSTHSNFDFSGLKVAYRRVVFNDDQKTDEISEIIDISGEFNNCSKKPRTYKTLAYADKRTESFEVFMGYKLGFSSEVSAEIDIPKIAKFGEKRTFSIEFTGGTKQGMSRETSVSLGSLSRTVSGCKRMKVSAKLLFQKVSGSMTAEVVISGRLKYDTLVNSGTRFFPNFNIGYDVYHYQVVKIPVKYVGIRGYDVKVKDYKEEDAICNDNACKKPKKLSAVITKGELERIGPSIGSQLQSDLIINPAGNGGKIVYDSSNPSQVQVQVKIVEKDTKPKYDDVGVSNVNLPLPNTVGRYTFPVLVTVITKGGDRVPSTRFIQYIDIEIKEER
jgi:hypothetical protein